MSTALSKMASPTTVHVCMYVCMEILHGDDQNGSTILMGCGLVAELTLAIIPYRDLGGNDSYK